MMTARRKRSDPGAGAASVIRSGPVLPGRDVLLLLGRHLVEGDPEGVQLEPGDLGIHRRGPDVDLLRTFGGVLDAVPRRQTMLSDATVPDPRRVPPGRTEPAQPA